MREGWTYKKLGEVAKISSGKAIPSSDIVDTFSEGLYPCYGGNGLRGYVSHYSNDGFVPVIGRVGALCGNVHLPQEKFYATEHALVVMLKTNDKPQFIEYLLSYLNLRQYAKGVAQPVLSASTLSEILIPVPPLSEQQRIVSELDLLSSIIEKKKTQLKEYDQLAQSIFYDMFGDPVTNEKGWEKASLSKMGLLARGVSKHRPRNAPELLGGTMPLIQTGDVSNADFYIRNYNSTYSELGVSQSKIWKAGTLCITIAATIGKCAILSFDACFPDSVVGFTVNNKLCNNEYVFFIFKCLQSILEENAPSVAQKNINLKVLNDLELPLPPLPLQQSFASKIEAIERQKALIQQSIVEVQMLFDSRMDDWFA